MPASVAPPPSVARPLYNMPVLPSLSKPTAAALVPAAPSAPSIMVLPQAAICGIIARMIAGAWLLRRFLERLRADQHADVEQDRQDRDHRDQADDQRDDAEPRQHQHHHAGRGGIADPPAHRLPAGMADIDGVDERIAEQAADQADDAVGRQHLGRRETSRRPRRRSRRCPSPRRDHRCRRESR